MRKVVAMLIGLCLVLAGCTTEAGKDSLTGTYTFEGYDFRDEFIFFSDGRFEYNGYEDTDQDDCWVFKCSGKFELEGALLTIYERECAEKTGSCWESFNPSESFPSYSGTFKRDGEMCFLWGDGDEQTRYCKP